MKKLTFLFVTFMVLSSHDMFLKMGTYFLEPNTDVTIELFNGTFEKSENTIDRNRMIDASLIGNGTRTVVDTSLWTESGETTILNFTTGEPGTWVAGLSTKAKNIELAATDFNNYLEHDGVLDMIEQRELDDTEGEDAIEKYSKHVKAIFQVGDQKTEDWKTELGYPIEFVPLQNPYEIKPGEQLEVKLLSKGQVLPHQLIYVGSTQGSHSHSHGEDSDHVHDEDAGEGHHHDATQLRTNTNGIVTMDITNEGLWYLRTIHMVLSEEEGLTHESNWATLTFEVGHGHNHIGGLSHRTRNSLIVLVGFLLIAGLYVRFKGRS